MEWLTDNIDHPIICIVFFLAGLILAYIAPLELPPTTSKQPIIVYKVDSQQDKPLLVYHADSKYQITGKVEEKRKIGKLFTITVNGNVFVVSEEKYNSIQAGDDIEL